MLALLALASSVFWGTSDFFAGSSDQHAGATRDTAYRTSQNLLNRFGREVTGIFAPNESSATGMLLAMKDAGLAGGRVKLVGFESGAQTVAALQSGDLQGLVVQNPCRSEERHVGKECRS